MKHKTNGVEWALLMYSYFCLGVTYGTSSYFLGITSLVLALISSTIVLILIKWRNLNE